MRLSNHGFENDHYRPISLTEQLNNRFCFFLFHSFVVTVSYSPFFHPVLTLFLLKQKHTIKFREAPDSSSSIYAITRKPEYWIGLIKHGVKLLKLVHVWLFVILLIIFRGSTNIQSIVVDPVSDCVKYVFMVINQAHWCGLRFL